MEQILARPPRCRFRYHLLGFGTLDRFSKAIKIRKCINFVQSMMPNTTYYGICNACTMSYNIEIFLCYIGNSNTHSSHIHSCPNQLSYRLGQYIHNMFIDKLLAPYCGDKALSMMLMFIDKHPDPSLAQTTFRFQSPSPSPT